MQNGLFGDQRLALEQSQAVRALNPPELTPSLLVSPDYAPALIVAGLVIALRFASHVESAEHRLCHMTNGGICWQFSASTLQLVWLGYN